MYLMPMTRGLDQYLANHLTSQHVFQVVTDPKLADAFFTDRIGESFQTQMENFFPAPKPAVEKKPADSDAKSQDTAAPGNPMMQQAVNRLESPASTFGRGKGTLFLVDAKSREVLWSTFSSAKGTLNHEMDRAASDIVTSLRKDLTPKKK